MRIVTKEFEIIEIGVEEGVDLGSKIKDSLLPNVVLYHGNSFIMQCCVSAQHISILYLGHLLTKTKFMANIGCVMSLSGHM